MSVTNISKTEAAKRQLDTAIDLFFEDGDAFSAHTLAFAAFKVMLNLYSHRKNDDFGEQIDKLISERIGWERFSNTANFLKHADRDPDGFLEDFHAEMVLPLIGLATLLYRKLSGDFSPKMEAFDFWIETLAADELGIEDADENKERLHLEAEWRQQLRDAPTDARMKFARASYHYFLDNSERIQAVVKKYLTEGKTVTQALDENMAEREKNRQ